jgi:hypothetical protein
MRIWLNCESGFRPSREAQGPYLRTSLPGDGLFPSAPGRSPRRAVRDAGLRSDDSQCSSVFQMWRWAPVAGLPFFVSKEKNIRVGAIKCFLTTRCSRVCNRLDLPCCENWRAASGQRLGCRSPLGPAAIWDRGLCDLGESGFYRG